MENGRHRSSMCFDQDDLLTDTRPGVTCATVARACACNDVPGAAEACCRSCPAQSNPLNDYCSCRDDDDWIGMTFRNILPSIKTCAAFAEDGWCEFASEVGINIASFCCISCAHIVVPEAPCRPDENTTALAARLNNEVGMNAAAEINSKGWMRSAQGQQLELTCGLIRAQGRCHPWLRDTFNIYSNNNGAPPMWVVELACPQELGHCQSIDGCYDEMMVLLQGHWNNDLPESPTDAAMGVYWCVHRAQGSAGRGLDRYFDTPDELLPCRQSCTACDLGPVCKSLLVSPMQSWDEEKAVQWLIDETDVDNLAVISAFSHHKVDGRALHSLIGLDGHLWSEKLTIPLSDAKHLLGYAERYAFPADLDRPPSIDSCSRVPLPIEVQRYVSITDLYAIDDVLMEFEIALDMETTWADDRITYIPSSSQTELKRCSRLCFDTSQNELAEGESEPSEATKCCDNVWIPRVTFTNAKEVTDIESPRVAWRQGQVTMKSKLRAKFKTTMSFDQFPFDSQDLVVEMQVSDNAIGSVQMQTGAPVIMPRVRTQGTPGWTLSEELPTSSRAASVSQGGSTYSQSIVTLHVQRLHGHFVDNYMSSIVMLCTLSWVCFSLKTKDIEARLATTVTLVLALMALSQVVTPSLPQTGKQTPAHKFMFQSNVLIVLVGIESIIVYSFDHGFSQLPSAKKGDGWLKALLREPGEIMDVLSTVAFPLSYVIMLFSTFPQLTLGEFVVYFPILFALVMLLAQVVMEVTSVLRYIPGLGSYCFPEDDDEAKGISTTANPVLEDLEDKDGVDGVD